jgi:diguanylate cyclase (GGDEF)-like protein
MNLDGFVQLVFNVYEAFTVALFAADGRSLTCLSAVSFAKSFDKTRLLPIDGTLPGWALKHKEALIIGNFDKDEETLGYYGQKEEIKSFMAYPLELPGVIVIDSKKKWVFTEKEKKILAHFASILGKEAEREQRLQEMEEEHEELRVSRRIISVLRQPLSDVSPLDVMLEEGLTLSGADMAIAGIEKNHRLEIIGSMGPGAGHFVGADCPASATIASTVRESGREFILPYESGYLKEKPLLFQSDGLRAKQYFGFPLSMGEKVYGFLGFVSLSPRPLKEGSIRALRDISVLLSLYLSTQRIREEMELHAATDQVTGAHRFAFFLTRITEMIKRKKNFSVMSIRLVNFAVYNRSMGVERGDRLLRKVYQGIEYCVGKNVCATRIGGAHFLVLLEGSDAPEVENILKIMKLTILTDLLREEGIEKNVIKAGTAYFPKDGGTAWELIEVADSRGKENKG